MYCKYCGEQNSSDQSYCQNCGKSIKTNTVDIERLSIEETKTAFCRKCGTAVLDRYCSECGTVGYNFEQKQGTEFKMPKMNHNIGSIDDLKTKVQDSVGDIKSVDDVKNIVSSKPIIKESFINSLKILGIGLLISFLLFAIVAKTSPMEDILEGFDELGSYEYQELSKIKPNFIDFFNISLQSPINIGAGIKAENEYSGNKASGDMGGTIKFNLLILLLIPLIAVVAAQFKLFKDDKSSKENLMIYGLTSFIFSIFVKIIALISQRNIKIVEEYYLDATFKFKLGFHDFWSIFSVFLIVFVIHIIVSMIMKKDNPFEILNIKQYPELGDKTKIYIKTMSIFTAILTVAIVLVMFASMGKEGAAIKDMFTFGAFVIPAFFINAWLFVFGNGLTFMPAMGQKPLSIFGAWKGITEAKRNGIDGTIWGYIFIIAVFVGLIYVIYKIVKDVEKEGFFVKLGFIAGSMSVINILMSFLISTSLKFSGKGMEYIKEMMYMLDLDMFDFITNVKLIRISYTFLNIAIMTFIWVFAIGALVYYLRENEIYKKVEDFVNGNDKKLLIGYCILILVTYYLFQTKFVEDMFRNAGSYIMNMLFPILRYFN